ncbi:zinc-binding dehydrogenase [SAR202 cluster bacterium AC-647-N09_OGT_505m]|nr:zinc-binding dehydrogenase [SAR202 cluster bacterium AC-647-N09_OGT_505m]
MSTLIARVASFVASCGNWVVYSTPIDCHHCASLYSWGKSLAVRRNPLKAVYISEFGDVDKLIYGDRPDPSPGQGEVVLRVRASALNHLDLGLRSGRGRVPRDLPRILGCDMAGEIALVGPGVTGFEKGDRVLVDNRLKCDSCGPCLLGQDQYCRNQLRVGVDVDGGHAEYCNVPAINVYKFRQSMSFEEAAAIPLAFHTAWHCLMVRGQLQPWETILIQAGGSGVGSAGIQIAKRIGARVITTAGSDDKVSKAQDLGADEGINYRNVPEFSQKVKELSDGHGADMILDVVGAAVWEQNLLSLREGGRLVITGTTSGAQTSMDLSILTGRPLTLMGSGGRSRRSFGEMMSVINRGELCGVVGSVFSLQDVAKAHQVMESRDFYGKLVIQGP